ncbi:MAG: MG2 domain-containing protein, partial [Rubrivivax sp.]
MRLPALVGALLASFLLLTAPPAAQAARVAVASPQGESATIEDFRLAFDQDVVAMGQTRQDDPATVVCEPGAAAAGSGRWEDARNWRFVFRQALPPGTRCTARLREQWRPMGGAVGGPAEFRFSTGGPAVAGVRPWPGAEIEEDQHFIVELTGPANEASVLAHAGCEIEGLGERIPVRVVTGADRDALLKSQRLTRQAERVMVLACQRPLPTAAKVRLVWGKGIASQAQPALRTTAEQRFNWQVRQAFTADFSCERERAQAPCLPLRPLTLRFSAPVARSVAAQVRLEPRDGGRPVAPHFARDDTAQQVSEVTFAAPLPENAAFTLALPPGLRDLTGRPLSNAGSFPLALRTGGAPPLAKFASAPFGVVELHADPETGPVLPVTLRHVQADLRAQAATGQVRVLSLQDDAQILHWFRKVQRHHETQMSARELGLPAAQWKRTVQDTDERGRTVRREVERFIATREVSLLRTEPQARRLALPAVEGGDPRPFEVVGIPLPGAGYHVVEVESGRLGAALLDKPEPMFVRSGVLVTNLGVHAKIGTEDALVWVTSLDRGRPVDGAQVAVSDCHGTKLWAGRTDARGMARIAQPLQARGARCPAGREALFVSARKADAAGVVDTAFVFTDWDRGIEPWRFNVPTSRLAQPALNVHTVFDRTLLRAGETVSMKHFARVRTARGLALPEPARLPTQARIVHQGSGDTWTLPLEWRGARSAVHGWPIPPAARLGSYRVVLERPGSPPGEPSQWESGEFRVEEFRVPLVDARLSGPKGSAVAPKELALEAQLTHLNGGGVAQAPLRLSALLRPRPVGFAGYEDFSFEPPAAGGAHPYEERPEDADEERSGRAGH